MSLKRLNIVVFVTDDSSLRILTASKKSYLLLGHGFVVLFRLDLSSNPATSE